MKTKLGSLLLIFIFGLSASTRACINDSKTSKTLFEEKLHHPTLGQAILSPKTETPNVKSLTKDIQKLKASPQTNDPAWWNELAGAYLRLNQPSEAAKLLEPVTNRFANDYGIHANLGTAYHLLGRYADAEREIRRDLELNPDGHSGMEKYHLALLEYLSRDADYRVRHVYVDEFTEPFLMRPGRAWPTKREQHWLSDSERKEREVDSKEMLHSSDTSLDNLVGPNLFFLAEADDLPAYTAKWDLGKDPKLGDGIIYMAKLNPSEPACKVMLGIVALKNREINLAKAAFQQAIQLGSPQAPILRAQINYLNQYRSTLFGWRPETLLFAGVVVLAVLYCAVRIRQFYRREKLKPSLP